MKVQFGSIITNGFGKIGGMFVKRLPSGHSLNVLPKTKSKSVLQTLPSLSGQTYIFRAWRNISSGDKTLYSDIASTTPVVDEFGNTKYLTARQMFTRLNSRRVNNTGVLIDVVNYNTDVPSGTFSILEIDFVDEDIDFNLNYIDGEGWTQVRIDKLADNSVSPRYINSQVLATYYTGSSITFYLYSTLMTKFPYAKLGDVYQVSFRFMNEYGVFGTVHVLKFVLT